MRLLFPVTALLLIPAASVAQSPTANLFSTAPAVDETPVTMTPVREMPVIDPRAQNQLKCPPTSRYEAAKRGEKLGLKKLNDLPPADAYKAVLREIDGCNAPIIVSYGFGAER
jgi:hypothetical protein